MTMIGMKKSFFLSLLVLIAAGLGGNSSAAGTTPALSRGQTVYVPVYSHIYSGDREHPLNLTATLSIRNTDPDDQISILSVDYFGNDGKLLRKYLDGQVILKKMATVRYIVKQSDKSGGSGANFLVRWKADREVNPPLIESIMIGAQMQQGISFTSRGQVIMED